MFQSVRSDGTKVERTELENELFKHALMGLTKVFSYARIRTTFLPRVKEGALSFFSQKGWNMQEFFQAAYTQRILYATGEGNEDVEEIINAALDPVRLADVNKLFDSCKFVNSADSDVVKLVLAKVLWVSWGCQGPFWFR